MSPEVRQELLQLLSALCDDELTQAQHNRLEQVLETTPGAQQLYLEYLDMHARLLVHPRVSANSPALTDPSRIRGATGASASSGQGKPFRQVVRYVAVAGATLAASLVLQFLWWHPPANRDEPPVASPRPPGYLATLSQTVGCTWEGADGPRRAGSRLHPGVLRLHKGVARVRFDAGPELVIEGPTVLRLDSSTAATLLRGKVVFKADDTAAPFRLHTPSSTLTDLGTEYAVLVSAEREEVHVFNGEVERAPRSTVGGGAPEHLPAGAARRYEPTTEGHGKPTPLDPGRFVRELADQDRHADAELLAYEGFDYRDPEALEKGTANGGQGWASPWRPGFARPLQEGAPRLSALNVVAGLSRPGAPVPAVGGSFDHTGFAKYFRRLAMPLRLDIDEVYYLSYLFRREGPPVDPLNAVTVQFRTSDELEGELAARGIDMRQRLNVGVDRGNDVFAHLQRIGVRAPMPLSYGATYLLVAKIVASSSYPDQVFVRVYAPDEPLEREEQGSWSVAGPLVQSDLVFDWLEVHINSGTRQAIDEVRLGTTWASVTAPWTTEPGARKADQK